MADTGLYLTDEQYRAILEKMLHLVESGKVKYWVEDDTTPGAKDTYSSIGLCNEKKYCNKENAMWPEDKSRTAMKYTQYHHYCPFDERILSPKKAHDINGCYYTCMLRTNRKRRKHEPRIKNVAMTDEVAKLLIRLAVIRLDYFKDTGVKYIFPLVDQITKIMSQQ